MLAPACRAPVFVSLLALALLLPGMAAPAASAAGQELPPADAEAIERLDTSPRHGEWIDYDAGDGATVERDPVRAWVVYPERPDPAPVVVVIHEIYGLTDWIRSVADQLAADGFIAIAPDLLSGKGPDGGGTEAVDQQQATSLIRGLDEEEVHRRLRAAADHAAALPAATDNAATLGFCWGGAASFAMAAAWEGLDAAVVFYGTSPDSEALSRVRAPVLGLYAGDDARVNSTIDEARTELDRLERPFQVELYEGAGHGFLRQQDGREGANLRASQSAWPRAVSFLHETLEGR